MPLSKKPSHDYIKDFLFTGGIQLIAGGSGSGKTTWLFQVIEAWLHGAKAPGIEDLEISDNDVPWAFITADRTEDGITRLYNRVKPNIDASKIYAWANLKLPYAPEVLVSFAQKILPKGGVLFVDCAHLLMGKGSLANPNDVRDFIAMMQRKLIIEHNIALVFTLYTAKQKSDSKYTGKDRLSGVVTWQGMCDSIVVFAINDEHPSFVEVDFYLRDRPAKHTVMTWSSEHRLFITQLPESVDSDEANESKIQRLTDHSQLRDWILAKAKGEKFTKNDCRVFFPEDVRERKESTIRNVLNELKKDNLVSGHYGNYEFVGEQ